MSMPHNLMFSVIFPAMGTVFLENDFNTVWSGSMHSIFCILSIKLGATSDTLLPVSVKIKIFVWLLYLPNTRISFRYSLFLPSDLCEALLASELLRSANRLNYILNLNYLLYEYFRLYLWTLHYMF